MNHPLISYYVRYEKNNTRIIHLLVSDNEEDNPFNPLATCVFDDGEEYFCESDGEFNGLYG